MLHVTWTLTLLTLAGRRGHSWCSCRRKESPSSISTPHPFNVHYQLSTKTRRAPRRNNISERCTVFKKQPLHVFTNVTAEFKECVALGQNNQENRRVTRIHAYFISPNSSSYSIFVHICLARGIATAKQSIIWFNINKPTITDLLKCSHLLAADVPGFLLLTTRNLLK